MLPARGIVVGRCDVGGVFERWDTITCTNCCNVLILLHLFWMSHPVNVSNLTHFRLLIIRHKINAQMIITLPQPCGTSSLNYDTQHTQHTGPT
jgi:hypothetical protein